MADYICYRINGRIYRFEHVVMDGGIPYGYCARLRKHAWLYPTCVVFEGKGGGTAQMAELCP